MAGELRVVLGHVAGREAQFYERCHKLVAALDRDRFERVGDDGSLLPDLEAEHSAAIAPKLAEGLALNPELALQPVAGGVIVNSYEPMMLSDALYEVLQGLTSGDCVAEVLDRLRREHQIERPDGLLLSLQQMRVVVAVLT